MVCWLQINIRVGTIYPRFVKLNCFIRAVIYPRNAIILNHRIIEINCHKSKLVNFLYCRWNIFRIEINIIYSYIIICRKAQVIFQCYLDISSLSFLKVFLVKYQTSIQFIEKNIYFLTFWWLLYKCSWCILRYLRQIIYVVPKSPGDIYCYILRVFDKIWIVSFSYCVVCNVFDLDDFLKQSYIKNVMLQIWEAYFLVTYFDINLITVYWLICICLYLKLSTWRKFENTAVIRRRYFISLRTYLFDRVS